MKRDKGLLLSTCAVLTLAALAASTAAAETKGPVTDDLGVLAIPKGAPIQIGAYWVMSGANSALGIDEQRGVEIAIKDQGGTLVGHPIKLNTEDDGCNAEGGQTAATKLAANPNTAIVIGTRLLQRRDAWGSDPLEGRDHRHRYGDHGAKADRAGPQARIRRLYAHGVQRYRPGRLGREICARCPQGPEDRDHSRRQPLRATTRHGDGETTSRSSAGPSSRRKP